MRLFKQLFTLNFEDLMKRLEYDATTEAEIHQYFQTRARQICTDGFFWTKELTKTKGGIETSFIKDGKTYGSYYGLNFERGHGYAIEAFKRRAPIVTSPDCKIEDFLNHHGIEHVIAGLFNETKEYKLISHFYGDKKAKRSQCYMMNHIDEGLFILENIQASDAAKKAFCLHPMLQNDEDLQENWVKIKNQVNSEILGLVVEYRNIANAYLSQRSITHLDEIALSPLEDVNDMLRADKVQNYKDFLIYHQKTHARSDILNQYFQNWLTKLKISQSDFQFLFEQLKSIEL